MRLDKLTLDHIGPFRHLELEFPLGQDDARADVHLLVGPNGTGKSTILESLSQLFTTGQAGFAGRCRSPEAVAAVEAGGETLAWTLATSRSGKLEWNGLHPHHRTERRQPSPLASPTGAVTSRARTAVSFSSAMTAGWSVDCGGVIGAMPDWE